MDMRPLVLQSDGGASKGHKGHKRGIVYIFRVHPLKVYVRNSQTANTTIITTKCRDSEAKRDNVIPF